MSGLPDELKDIEDRKGQRDLGVFSFRIYEGARQEGASRLDALMLLSAWFLAMFLKPQDEGEL